MPEITKLPESSQQAIRYYRELLISGNPELTKSINFALAGYLLGLQDANIITKSEADELLNYWKGE